jgi:hypothetical protein
MVNVFCLLFFAQGPANFAGQDFMLNIFYPQQFVSVKKLGLASRIFCGETNEARSEVNSRIGF